MRGPTCTSSTSIVPETALLRRLQLAAKIDNAIRAVTRRQLSILACTGKPSVNETGFHYLSQAIAPLLFCMAGYSGTPLAQKLGIKSGTTVVALNAPSNYRKLLGKLPIDVTFTNRIGANGNFVHLFTKNRSELAKQLKELRRQIAENGVVWISWPKKSSRVNTDITEDVIRDAALPIGFVDIKVCAVDETWSGLKLMIRRENRKSTK